MREIVEKTRIQNINGRAIVNGKHLSSEHFSQEKAESEIYILYYVSRGRGMLYYNGKEYVVDKGESFMIFPGCSYSLVCDSFKPWELRYIEFHNIDVSWILSLTAFSRTTPVAPKIPELAHLFNNIPDCDTTVVFQSIRTHAMLYYLFSYYIEHFPYELKISNNYVEAARDYILANYVDPDCTPAAVAAFVKIDRTYLYKLFKKETGTSVGEYIINYRIERACLMLKRSELSVKNIAIAVGFMDQLYFSKVFKKYMNMSPTAYRKTAAKI